MTQEKVPEIHSGVCDRCKAEVASGPNKDSVEDAVKRHKKKAHRPFKSGK